MISDNLRHIRKEVCKFTQAQLSELTGIPQSTYSGWERNISEPTASQVVILAKVFNVPIEMLLQTR